MSSIVKIALVDDEVLFRKGIAFLLQKEDNFEIIFEASNGEELISKLNSSESKPDIIIMDLKMPVLNGVEATKIIRKSYPDIKIIALTSYDTKSFVANMIQVGAVAYLIKNTTPKDLIHTVNEVAKKGFYYSQIVLKTIQETIVSSKNSKGNLETGFLSPREIEILQLICLQKTTTEIADHLFLSPRTVEGHRNNLLLKTESRNIAGLVVYAIQNEIAVLTI
ncbi:response regulator transcription factor [Flavobacterium sp. MMLR14_040]|jgi:DNA-binding NarL/FixJ family response regulator|uniref:DNA-binding response regulator n=1 Tax=Flavobacterium pectinovorum TaxID=29533 RepID=A0AB36P6G3_9FLAO|nr:MULTISPECIES: response regulator transcription factor [Flavobacterium]KIQ14099.1 LuxR family transcriptional regulator [Flavobacterium sp. MEB061]MDW8848991.1 response regulator transcription factor [Flavobacterium sp. MMLR14_040]OXB07964.1 DNA-binding response regulator [Flavobacterium pectinovorum]SHM86025.1 two component transcriptional regulator, LuxR family [Flavobacterium pectinovorum]